MSLPLSSPRPLGAHQDPAEHLHSSLPEIPVLSYDFVIAIDVQCAVNMVIDNALRSFLSKSNHETRLQGFFTFSAAANARMDYEPVCMFLTTEVHHETRLNPSPIRLMKMIHADCVFHEYISRQYWSAARIHKECFAANISVDRRCTAICCRIALLENWPQFLTMINRYTIPGSNISAHVFIHLYISWEIYLLF